MRTRTALALASAAALPALAFAVPASAAVSNPAAPQTCTRTVNYSGGPYRTANGNWAESILLEANTCNNKFEAAFQCVTASGGYQWEYGNIVQALYTLSIAVCPASDPGYASWGYKWLNGSTWVYVGH